MADQDSIIEYFEKIGTPKGKNLPGTFEVVLYSDFAKSKGVSDDEIKKLDTKITGACLCGVSSKYVKDKLQYVKDPSAPYNMYFAITEDTQEILGMLIFTYKNMCADKIPVLDSISPRYEPVEISNLVIVCTKDSFIKKFNDRFMAISKMLIGSYLLHIKNFGFRLSILEVAATDKSSLEELVSDGKEVKRYAPLAGTSTAEIALFILYSSIGYVEDPSLYYNGCFDIDYSYPTMVLNLAAMPLTSIVNRITTTPISPSDFRYFNQSGTSKGAFTPEMVKVFIECYKNNPDLRKPVELLSDLDCEKADLICGKSMKSITRHVTEEELRALFGAIESSIGEVIDTPEWDGQLFDNVYEIYAIINKDKIRGAKFRKMINEINDLILSDSKVMKALKIQTTRTGNEEFYNILASGVNKHISRTGNIIKKSKAPSRVSDVSPSPFTAETLEKALTGVVKFYFSFIESDLKVKIPITRSTRSRRTDQATERGRITGLKRDRE